MSHHQNDAIDYAFSDGLERAARYLEEQADRHEEQSMDLKREYLGGDEAWMHEWAATSLRIHAIAIRKLGSNA